MQTTHDDYANAPRTRAAMERFQHDNDFNAPQFQRALKRLALAEADLNEVRALLPPERAQFYSPESIEGMTVQDFYANFPGPRNGYWKADEQFEEWEAQHIAWAYWLAKAVLNILAY